MNMSLIEEAIYDHFPYKGFKLRVKDPFVIKVLDEYYVVCIIQRTSLDNTESDYSYIFYSVKNECVIEDAKTISWVAFLPSLKAVSTIDRFGNFKEREELRRKFDLIIENLGRKDVSREYEEYLLQSKEYKTESAKSIYDQFINLALKSKI